MRSWLAGSLDVLQGSLLFSKGEKMDSIAVNFDSMRRAVVESPSDSPISCFPSMN